MRSFAVISLKMILSSLLVSTMMVCILLTKPAGAVDYFHWLKHGSWKQRVHAMYHLGYSGYKPSFWILVEYLGKEFKEPNDSNLGVRVRQAAAVGLGKLEDERAVPYLVERFKKEKKPKVRKAIIFALSFYNKKSMVEVVQMGLKDESQEVRWEALQTASAMGDDAPVSAVSQFAAGNDNPSVAIIAAYVLYMSGQEKEKNRDTLLNGLQNKNPEVRYWATHYAARALGVEALDAIIRASEIESVYWVMKEMDDNIYTLARKKSIRETRAQVDTMENLFKDETDKKSKDIEGNNN
ncbi:MAG: HEAT repeat domain-containing protein [Spirochaetota bacterium]